MSSERNFVLASRGSALAQIQTNIVLDMLVNNTASDSLSNDTFSTHFMATGGDKNQTQALFLMGGKALWTKELEQAMLEGEVDMLVHSLKDVPTVLPDGCILGAVCKREEEEDCLVVRAGETWKSLDELPDGSVVGTSSVRRVAQLKRGWPGLRFLDVRGNLNTRLSKLDASDSPYSAIILAKAGMLRLGWGHRITSTLPLLYAVSQGALGVEIRSNDAKALTLCRAITDRDTEVRCLAERACLRVLEGGCSVPVGVRTEFVDGHLTLTAAVTSLDGAIHVEHTMQAEVKDVQEAEEMGKTMAVWLLENGAKVILDDINKDRDRRTKEAEAQDRERAAAEKERSP